MNRTIEFLKRNSLVIGILLMFVLTWPIDLANSGVLPFQVPFAVALLVGYGFVVASLIMTALTLGKGGVIALLKRFLIWRLNWKWYLGALLFFPAMQFTAVYLNAALSQTPIDFSTVYAYKIFGSSANLALLILPFFLIDSIVNGEEIGWRGYILPRLQAKYSALVSSLIVGVLWGLWHIPKFLAEGNTTPFAVFMIDTIAKAVLFTWLYNNTKGSLLLVALFHASGNTASVFLPIANTATGGNLNTVAIVVVLDIMAAIAVTMIERPGQLSRTELMQTTEVTS